MQEGHGVCFLFDRDIDAGVVPLDDLFTGLSFFGQGFGAVLAHADAVAVADGLEAEGTVVQDAICKTLFI